MSKKGINKFRALNSIYSINENESGITLIALVVTIILLILLSGIVFSTIFGQNGILRNSKAAQKKYTTAQLNEKIELAQQELIVEKVGYDYTIKDLIAKIKEKNPDLEIIYMDDSENGRKATYIIDDNIYNFTKEDSGIIVYNRDGKINKGDKQKYKNREELLNLKTGVITFENEPNGWTSGNVNVTIKAQTDDESVQSKIDDGTFFIVSSINDVDKLTSLKESVTTQVVENQGDIVYACLTDGNGTYVATATDLIQNINKNIYTLKYNLDGGEMSEETTITYRVDSEAIKVPSPTRTGYIFENWNTKADGTGKAYNGGYTIYPEYVASNLDLYAQWKPITYYVAFDGNGSSNGSMEKEEFTYGESKPLNENVYSKDSYQLAGWAMTNSDSEKYYDMQPVMNLTAEQGATVTLYAKWAYEGNAANNHVDSASHTHIWTTKYDDNYHWEECSVCGEVKSGSKQSHTFVGDGGDKYRDTMLDDVQYREICSCGYKSKILVTIHGNATTYSKSHSVSYCDGPSKLEDILQISKSNFNSWYGNKTTDAGTNYIFFDPDGDGKGWVLCGGVTTSSEDGRIGTVEQYTGISGYDNSSFSYADKQVVELYVLARYFSSDSTPTISEFLNTINATVAARKNSPLKGIREKYSKISNAVFQSMAKEFSGYCVYPGGYNYSMQINVQHTGHDGPGNIVYQVVDFDSSIQKYLDWSAYSDGIERTGDISGRKNTGKEEYLNTHYTYCSLWSIITGQMEENKTYTCTGHNVYGYKDIFLGNYYHTVVRKGNTVTVTTHMKNVGNGVTYTMNSNSYTLSNTSVYSGTPYTNTWGASFTYTDSDGVKRSRADYSQCALPRDVWTKPTITHSETKQNIDKNNGWALSVKIDVSGTAETNQVTIVLKDASTGKQLGNTYYANVDTSTKKYSFSFVPEIEAPESGRTINLIVTDKGGNTSTSSFVLKKVDASMPKMTNEINYSGQWAKYRSFTISATDSGSGNVKIGINRLSDMTSATKNGDTYTKTYTFSGEKYDEENWVVFIQDAAGNLNQVKINIGKLDNTKPTLSAVINGDTATVSASDTGSGVSQIGYCSSRTDQIIWQDPSNNKITLSDSNKYYIYAKDKAGNLSKPYIVEK